MEMNEKSKYGLIIAILVTIIMVAMAFNIEAVDYDPASNEYSGEVNMLVIEAEDATNSGEWPHDGNWNDYVDSYASGDKYITVGWNGWMNYDLDDVEGGAYRIYLTLAKRFGWDDILELCIYYYGPERVSLYIPAIDLSDEFNGGDHTRWEKGRTVEVGVMYLGDLDGVNEGYLHIKCAYGDSPPFCLDNIILAPAW